MDYDEKIRLQKMYEEEASEEDLIEMALVDSREYDVGIYSLVMDAVKKRGLLDKVSEIKNGHRDGSSGEKWVEACRFSDHQEKDILEVFFKNKKIEINTVANDYSPFNPAASGGGMIRVKESQISQAKKLIDEVRGSNKSEDIFIDEGIRKAVINVLNKRNIENKEIIADEVVKEIALLYKEE